LEAVILIGIQGSGKSTFYRDHFLGSHVRISLDELKTRQRERSLLEACLGSGQAFVVDNTNVRAAERMAYIAAAKRKGYQVRGYFFDAALRDALRWNGGRTGAAKIPPAGIVGTFKRLERPSPAEGFDELYVVSRDDSDQFVVRLWTEGVGNA